MTDIKILKQRAKHLRRNDTLTETILWNMIRKRQLSRYRFKRQFIIAPYIVDFVCLYKKLIIEIDGEDHELKVTYDNKRTKYLAGLGYRVIRFSNDDVLGRCERVLEQILLALES